ncbi:helix-turn-helix domain-containing protein [Alkalicoccobacillus plakortidis]|uniref:Helix-turn-helix domain-containing protein n=1 Tax=Alkalicoccobacillus plakortidis TaxID=444060 RepID=A0ABT0XHY4_9BACI|nr:helix-turn-helix transcriptional regulator [Alkalicoccobacillus plakortidis]MCM2675512.1 helix-turn-helix domain-containing protein [Alkalicoccobacillus plakortidis]
MEFGDRIAHLRRGKNLTQAELADSIGITRASLSHYEKNRREPDYATLKVIANFFGVTVDYLLGTIENEEVDTIAAHHDSDEWSEDELKEIEKFKEFVRIKRLDKNKE